MTTIHAKGIDGSEPVGFLAGVGALQLLTESDPSVRLSWVGRGGVWGAAFVPGPATDTETVVDRLSSRLLALSRAGELSPFGFDAAIGIETTRFRALSETTTKVAIDGLRDHGFSGGAPGVSAAVLSSFGSDGVWEWKKAKQEETDEKKVEQRVLPTPISFSNGSSGNYLLKDFRKAAALCDLEHVRATFDGQPILEVITSLNWHPTDHRPAAHRWLSPDNDNAQVDPCVNALALIGLSVCTAVPSVGRLQALGWREIPPRGFLWPLWEEPLGIDLVSFIMAHVQDPTLDRRRGIAEVRFSRVVNPDGKRNYFAPSRRER